MGNSVIKLNFKNEIEVIDKYKNWKNNGRKKLKHLSAKLLKTNI